MKSHFFKALPQFNQHDLKVDRENGVIRGVQIVMMGANKNGSYFNSKFISDLVSSGNEQTQGVKSRFGHPTMCSTSLGTYVGRYKNFTQKDGKAFADLHLDATAKKVNVPSGGVSMWEYILDMAENNPDMFGNSIHINSETFEENVDGKKVESHIFQSLIASDLVDSPAATDGLFENSEDLGVITATFLDANPQIFEALEKNPTILGDFFERYFDYANRKSLNKFDMNLKQRISKFFSAAFDIELTLATGDIVTVVTEGEEPKEGDAVNDKDGKPVEDGDHLLADGRTLKTEGGKVKSIADKPQDPPKEGEEPTLTEVMQSVNNLSNDFKQFKTKFEKSSADSEEAILEVAKQFGALDKRVTDMGKTIRTKYQAPPAENPDPKKQGESGYDADAVREARENRKNNNK